MIRMEVEKFLEYQLRKRISDRDKTHRRLLLGHFKEEGSNTVRSGDNFIAYELQGCSALEVYECYVAYYNHTRTPEERVRIAVFADWSKGVGLSNGDVKNGE